MLFSKILGHGEILYRLETNILSKDFEGVYLFTGPGSVGKLTIARQLSRYLLCTGLLDDTCRCDSCRLLPNVPDYFEIAKNDDSINTSDVDTLIDFLSLVPYNSRVRVAVVDNAHNLNHTARNNLLKTFEDIKSNCIVILVTNQYEHLLTTLASRCYRIEFGPLRTDEIKSILKTKGHDSVKLDDMKRMLPYFNNNVLVNFGKYSEYAKSVPDFLKDVLSMPEDTLLSHLRDIDDKNDLPYFIDTLIIAINDILKLRYDSPDVVYNLKHLDFLEELSGLWKEDLCVLVLEKLRSAQIYMNRNINLKYSQLVFPIFLWLHYFIHKKKSNSDNN